MSMASRTSTTSYAKVSPLHHHHQGELVAGLNLNMTAAEMRERVGSIPHLCVNSTIFFRWVETKRPILATIKST